MKRKGEFAESVPKKKSGQSETPNFSELAKKYPEFAKM
jgi:hypothetical protein